MSADRLPRTDVSNYFDTIREALQAQFEILTPVIVHSGEMGANDCAALADLIRRYLPKRIGVGTGFVVNHESDSLSDQYSREKMGRRSSDPAIGPQSDILLVDDFHNAPLCAEGTFHVYPVEMVMAVIEVTRDLSPAKLKKDADKIARVRALADDKKYMQTASLGPDGPGIRPRGYIVGLRSSVDASDFVAVLNGIEDELRPNAVYLLDKDRLLIRHPYTTELVDIGQDSLFKFIEMLRVQAERFPIGPVDLNAYVPTVVEISIPQGSPLRYVTEEANWMPATGPSDFGSIASGPSVTYGDKTGDDDAEGEN